MLTFTLAQVLGTDELMVHIHRQFLKLLIREPGQLRLLTGGGPRVGRTINSLCSR